MKKQQKTDNFRNVTIAVLFRGIPLFLKILFMGNKPNFKNPETTTNNCNSETYNDIFPKTHNKNKPNTNPILDAKPISKNRKNNTLKEIPRKNKPYSNPNRRSAEGGQTQFAPGRVETDRNFLIVGDGSIIIADR